jgi:hypothetical protein
MVDGQMHHISACPMNRWQSTRYAQRRERSPSAGIPDLDEIVLAARHEQAPSLGVIQCT